VALFVLGCDVAVSVLSILQLSRFLYTHSYPGKVGPCFPVLSQQKFPIVVFFGTRELLDILCSSYVCTVPFTAFGFRVCVWDLASDVGLILFFTTPQRKCSRIPTDPMRCSIRPNFLSCYSIAGDRGFVRGATWQELMACEFYRLSSSYPGKYGTLVSLSLASRSMVNEANNIYNSSAWSLANL
jgi:hypothetical protein